jgi:hypothetical protein
MTDNNYGTLQRKAILTLTAAIAALSLPLLLLSSVSKEIGHAHSKEYYNGYNYHHGVGGGYSGQYSMGMQRTLSDDSLTLQQQLQQRQQQKMANYDSVDFVSFDIPDVLPNVNSLQDTTSSASVKSYSHLISTSTPLPRYTINDALFSSTVYTHLYALLIYDPATDKFISLLNRNHYWFSEKSWELRLFDCLRYLPFLLRETFPERFLNGIGNGELVIPISSGDYPAVANIDCLQRNNINNSEGTTASSTAPCSNSFAPVLHFGSTFRNPTFFPNIIPMPMPDYNHLGCFEYYAATGGEEVCDGLRGRSDGGELVYGSSGGGEDEFDELIPQLVWRG